MTSGPFPPTFPGLGHDQLVAQHIEDFEAQMAAAKALLPGDEPPAYSSGNDNNASSAPSSQLFSAVSSSSNNNNNNNPPQLQAGRVWSSESVVSFNNLCLKNAVANAFEYEQVRDSPQPGWAVRLTFSFFSGAIGGADDNASADNDGGSFVVSLPGPYGSKKEAKAAAAENGLQVLQEAIEKRGAATKKKMPSGAAGEGGEVRDAAAQGGPWDEEEEEVENWVGLLGEYCQAEGKPRPMFQEFSLGANYSMECIMPPDDRPVPDGAPPQPEAFGGRNILFNSKKAAKTNAAREAVRWLRAAGCMPKKGHPTKKKMKAAQMMAATTPAFPAAPTSNANPVPLPIPTPISGDQQGNNAASGSDSEGGSSSSSAGAPGLKDRSLGEQVMILCSKLGCAQPIYKILPDPRVPSMWSGAAYFPHDPAVGSVQPVGEVRNVYGKKKAREEVAKKVLKHLKAMQAERQKVVDGVLAGTTAAAAAGGASA
ncbi:putative double-stranded rna-binding protein [Lasiodiplodia theobromae]|uniref:Double-stranded RNA-binding protein n=1 Tax=Lasiodiplodia theobromae TaxID=45133 RepID=UPI0015C343A5|nr:Double-stranded RNA-binding protein [Lasiodiplodia theobromae]KAF4545638.1 Double-stranded RNA-binding protein [Lasiodiplodia theobromae]KAF9636191.1 putative double-stranded rna-binding protein [Lasiodiplodia theobromae]